MTPRTGSLGLLYPQGDKTVSEDRTWQELCAAASKEPGPEQLMALVSDLMKGADERKLPARGFMSSKSSSSPEQTINP
jgi:hypothetical protein